MEPQSTKPVREDWTFFNEAAEMRAAYLKGLVVPRPTPTQPQPPTDWLRRGFGIGAAVLATGMAAALVLWVLFPPLPTPGVPPSIAAIPAPPSPTPQAKVVVDFTRFTTITVRYTVVVTGWQYNSSEDTKPRYQYCYVRPRNSGTVSVELAIYIADSSVGIYPYDERDMAPLTRADYDLALPKCTWAPGTTLPRATIVQPKGRTT